MAANRLISHQRATNRGARDIGSKPMQKRLTIASLAVAGLAVSPFLGMGAAAAADGDLMANLQPAALNGVPGSGTAMVEVNGNMINVTMQASGLLADNPHAAHIHYGTDARHECPTAADDADGNGKLSTTEGGPAYGEITVSLTKSGDTSPDSALAVDRFDTAPGGNLSYERGSIEVSSNVAGDILDGESVVVIHGVDHNGSGKYDGNAKSELDPSLPTEATDPALCGVLTAAPAGGAATGYGGTASGSDNSGVIALGGGLLLAAAGAGAVAARRARTTA